MNVTSFKCDSCGAAIELNNLLDIVACPYCNNNFYLNKEWEKWQRTTSSFSVLRRELKQ